MANPFPGVDPFIEATGLWVGFHNTLIGDCAKLLNAALPANYAALVDVRVELVDVSEDRPRGSRPDVGIVRDLEPVQYGESPIAVMAELQPATLTLPDFDTMPEAYIDILSLPDRELITSMEILSPTNKSKNHGGEYISKRAAMVGRGVNLVEVDLLLEGQRLKTKEPLPPGDFFAYISRSNRRPQCEVYAWSIRRKLPRIPIPLKPSDGEVILDLAAAFASTYEGGRYGQTVRYDLQLPESVAVADREWAYSLVKSTVK